MDFGEAVKKKTKKKRVQFESEALLQSDGKNKSSYQVKILVTKEEAIRLLSKCQDGNILEFKDWIVPSLKSGRRRQRYGYGKKLKRRVRSDFERRPLLEKERKVNIVMRKEVATNGGKF
ncbi:hypothetical protein AAHA92_12886 [Salvia divinorum]|uniref:DUF7890 domain-containing protein n=1 Tax=Salvia divinorum TaxID=28513 RepID=A0ABD1HAA1_SALDI